MIYYSLDFTLSNGLSTILCFSSVSVSQALQISEYILCITVLTLAAYIFYEYWPYIGFLTVLYITLRILNTKYKQVVDVTGKGVLITGCDTGNFKIFFLFKKKPHYAYVSKC